MNVKNFIDMHVHVGPEPLPRKFTAKTIEKAEKGKIKGMVLKNHFSPTSHFIKSLGEPENPILIGSVVLNSYVGGLNPEAIYAAANPSKRPIIVWFPTINAENFLRKSKFEIPLEWARKGFKPRLSAEINGIKIASGGKLTKITRDVLKAIKENNCILATGHLSWQETALLVKESLKAGIKKIIVTHPIYQLIDMPMEVQKQLAQNEGVYIEHSYSMRLIDRIPIKKIAGQIKAVEAEKCIMTSDMGQISSPKPSEALSKFAELLKEEITEKEIRTMGEANPRKLIGLRRND